MKNEISIKRFAASLLFLTLGLALPFFFHFTGSGPLLIIGGMIFNWEGYNEPIKWDRKEIIGLGMAFLVLIFLVFLVFLMKRFPKISDGLETLWFNRWFLAALWLLMVGFLTREFLRRKRAFRREPEAKAGL